MDAQLDDLYSRLARGQVAFSGDPGSSVSYLSSVHSPGAPLDYSPVVPYLQPKPAAAAPMSAPDIAPPTASPAGRPSRDYYDSIVSDYLKSLMQPTSLPRPQPLSASQALVLGLNPNHRDELLNEFRQPYALSMQETELNQARREKAAGLASDLSNRMYMRDWQERQQEYAREQVLANAGTWPYEYKNPSLGAMAQQRYQLNKSLIDQRNRSKGPKPPPTRSQAIEGVLKDISRVQGSLGQPSVTEPILAQGDFPQKRDASEMWNQGMGEYHNLMRTLGLLRSMSEPEYQQWLGLGGDEQQKIVDAWNAQEESPQPDYESTLDQSYR